MPQIRLHIWKWSSLQSKWVNSSKYVDFIYRPESIRVSHKMEWRNRSSGTKRYKKFKWKARQASTLTFSGQARTTLCEKLEWLATSKVVICIRGATSFYTEPGGSSAEYPILVPTVPWDGSGTMPDPDTELAHEGWSFYIITNVDITSTGYRAAAHTDDPTKRELFHTVTLTLERVEPSKMVIP